MAASPQMDDLDVGMLAGILKRCCARVKKLLGKAEHLGIDWSANSHVSLFLSPCDCNPSSSYSANIDILKNKHLQLQLKCIA